MGEIWKEGGGREGRRRGMRVWEFDFFFSFSLFFFFFGVAQPTSDVTLDRRKKKTEKENNRAASLSFSSSTMTFMVHVWKKWEETRPVWIQTHFLLSLGRTHGLLWPLLLWLQLTIPLPVCLLLKLEEESDCNAAEVSELLPVELQLREQEKKRQIKMIGYWRISPGCSLLFTCSLSLLTLLCLGVPDVDRYVFVFFFCRNI